MRSLTSFGALSVFLATPAILSCSGESDSTPKDSFRRIHREAVVIDAHAHPKPGAAETLNLGEKTGTFEVDFLTMKEGGLDAAFFSLPMLTRESSGLPEPALILEHAAAVVAEVERYGDLAEVAMSPADISRIHELGKRAVLLGVEGADPFGGNIGTLARFADAGVRMITLPPEAITTAVTGQTDRDNLPLNEFGKRVIEEMNRLGMIIDITHTPDSLQMDIIRSSARPVIASHSCTRALNDIPRQIPDAIIRALADRDGAICVTFYPGHISSDYPDRTVSVQELVDHIDHAVEVAGTDHVCFGSDFLGSEHHTVGLESAAGLPSITLALLERGYSHRDVEKILGGNLLRVFESVQNN